MKKRIALGVVGAFVLLIAGIGVAAAMQPDSFRVERSRTVAASVEEVRPQLLDLREWAEWNPWADLDPNQTTTFSDDPVGLDARYDWDGNDDVGRGHMTITEVTDSSVRYALVFVEPFASEADVGIDFEREGDERTRVTWWMEGQNDFMAKLFGLFMDFETSIAADFDRGLERLERAAGAAG